MKRDTRNNQPWSLPEGFLFDEEDRWLAESVHWFKDKHGAIVAGSIYFHRLVMKAPRGMYVDHINRNPSDNRRCNLRLVKPAENIQNQSYHKDSSSKYRGVHLCSSAKLYPLKKPWMARACVNRKAYHLGMFATAEEAAEAAKQWRLQNMPGALS